MAISLSKSAEVIIEGSWTTSVSTSHMVADAILTYELLHDPRTR